MDAEEMRKLGVLPTMYFGMYNVNKLPCVFHDERRNPCCKMGYSTIYMPENGYTIVACQEHWDDYWRKQD
jgi:hypothetical protein